VSGRPVHVTTFDEITTTKLRLKWTGRQFFHGILVARSGFGQIAGFPPIVSAGVDRDVMLDAKRIVRRGKF